MRESLRTAAIVLGVVVVVGLIGAGTFVAFGSQEAIYATIAIAPILVVVAAVWVARRIESTGTNQVEYIRRRASDVGRATADMWERRSAISSRYPDVFAGGLGLGTDQLVADLNAAGVDFDPDSGTFTLGSVSNLEEINTLHDRVQSMSTELDAAFASAVSDRIAAIETELERLDELAQTARFPDETSVPDDDWEAAGTALDRARDSAHEMIDAAAEQLQDVVTAADSVDHAAVEEHVDAARAGAVDRDFSTAVTELVQARDAVRTAGDSAFSSSREALQSLLETVEESGVTAYLDDPAPAEVRDVKRSVSKMDDAMALSELTRYRRETTERCIEVVLALESDLAEIVGELERADLPAGFYSVPEAANTEYATQLRETAELSAFEERWQTAVDDLTAALAELEPKSQVVSGYDNVRDQIESQLRSEGRIHGSDLPVRANQEQFLGLYYREHPDEVTFDIDEPSLTVAGGPDTYEVEVTVTFEHGGPDREVTVAFEGDGYDASKTITTPLVGSASFSDVPYGEYTIRADPAPSDFGTVTDSVAVDGETSVDIDLPALTLRDRVCDGIEADAERILPDVADTFDDRFAEEGHLRSGMAFGIEDEYVPCLLAVWGEQSDGATAELHDDEVVVYDAETIRSELENVVAYNLDDGDSMSFDDLRERYLSAPVPDETIAAVAADLDAATADGTTLRKS
jgi:hypothetical protein